MFFSPCMDLNYHSSFTFPYSDIVVAILSTILIVLVDVHSIKGAVDEFKQKKPGMMALVSF